jgi:hypothetical protein
MKLGTRGVIWSCIIIITFDVISCCDEPSCCEHGISYFSLYLHGCLECPESPSLDCKKEHGRDIDSCLANCVKGNKYTVIKNEQRKATFG